MDRASPWHRAFAPARGVARKAPWILPSSLDCAPCPAEHCQLAKRVPRYETFPVPECTSARTARLFLQLFVLVGNTQRGSTTPAPSPPKILTLNSLPAIGDTNRLVSAQKLR